MLVLIVWEGTTVVVEEVAETCAGVFGVLGWEGIAVVGDVGMFGMLPVVVWEGITVVKEGADRCALVFGLLGWEGSTAGDGGETADTGAGVLDDVAVFFFFFFGLELWEGSIV